MKAKDFLIYFNVLLVLMGFILEPSLSIFTNFYHLIIGSDTLITDYFIKGSIGSSFLNAGLVGLFSIYLLYRFDALEINASFPAMMLMSGFAFFGKNLLNVWPIIFGTYLYSRYKKIEFGPILPVAFYATSISPLISELLYVYHVHVLLRIIMALAMGISIGFIIVFFSSHMYKVHKGYNLYNVGFSIGIISTLYVSLLRSFGLSVTTHVLWYSEIRMGLYGVFYILFILCIVYAVFKDNTSIKKYLFLLKTSGHKADYIKDFGFEAVLINIGMTGIVSLLFLNLIQAPLNGPTLGGVLTIVGFAASGKHIRNIIPIFLGVYLGSLTKIWSLTTPSVIIGALFATGLAPLVGEFGFIPGLIASYITSSVFLNTGFLHGGLNLYNTGFAIGIVCSFLVPLYEALLIHDNDIEI